MNSLPKMPVSKTPMPTAGDNVSENPFTAASSKPKSVKTPPATSPPEKPQESKSPRRIAKFRYERYTGKGSSANAVRDALKRFDWANQEDIVLDAKSHEIRIGLTAESPDYEPARKALQNAGFVLAPGVTTATIKD